jgi:hypothetical protein
MCGPASWIRMENRAWGVHVPPGGLQMLEKHPAVASAPSPTTIQYAAVFSILAAFAAGVLTLVGIL